MIKEEYRSHVLEFMRTVRMNAGGLGAAIRLLKGEIKCGRDDDARILTIELVRQLRGRTEKELEQTRKWS